MVRVKNPTREFANVTRRGAADGRPAIPPEMLTPFQLDETALQGICVPLIWKREIYLPPERSLEAWYFLPSKDLDDSEWQINPRTVISDRSNQQELAQFVFEASLEPEHGKRRLAAAGLITDLQKRSDGTVWFAQERRSFSIWTDTALQIWHRHLVGFE